MMLRLFIALHLPDEIKTHLGNLIEKLSPLANDIKWIDPKNIHLTLKFLGDTDENQVTAISGGIQTALAGKSAFEIGVGGCGGFPNLKNPRVIWAGLKNAGPAKEIARDINHQLASIGIEKDNRPLSPHLTIGRVKNNADLIKLLNYIESLKFDAGYTILNKVALIQSTLTPKGPIYKSIGEFNLE